jgi:hypothetical protein
MKRVFSATIAVLITTAFLCSCVPKGRQVSSDAASVPTQSSAAGVIDKEKSLGDDTKAVSTPAQNQPEQAQGRESEVASPSTENPDSQAQDEEKAQSNDSEVVSPPTDTPTELVEAEEKVPNKDSEVVTPPTTPPAEQTQGEEKAQGNSSDAVTYPIKYDFDSLDKVNDFDGYYLTAPSNVIEDDWLTQLAGGRENTITFKFGKVVYNSNAENGEPYIELQGKEGMLTLIANGARYEYDDSSNQLKRITINFLTGKKLEGNQVVKDYSEGKQKIILIIDYNENGTASPIVMFCAKGDSEDIPANNFYTVEAIER